MNLQDECLKAAQQITQQYIELYGATFREIDKLDKMIAYVLYKFIGGRLDEDDIVLPNGELLP